MAGTDKIGMRSHTFDSGRGKGTRDFGVALVVGRTKERNVVHWTLRQLKGRYVF